MIENLPKVELHLHLDGSIRLETACELLNMNYYDVKKNMVASSKCEDLNDYLTKFNYPEKILQTKENLERVAYELAVDLKKDNVIYAEVRFAPLKHINEGLSLDDVVLSILRGLLRVDVKVNLILCMMRNDSFNDNLKVIELALKYLNKGVVGIDLAGAEALYKTSSFKNLFDIALKNNIPFTIHAGEADGYDSILAAINFKTKRIGHGINSIHYDDLIEIIKEKNILLEVCPTSNVQTNVVDRYYNHPIKKLFDKGVKLCINTDNRTVSNVTLNGEYNKLYKYFNFDIDSFIKMNLFAIEHAFISDLEKNDLKEEYLKLINR